MRRLSPLRRGVVSGVIFSCPSALPQQRLTAALHGGMAATDAQATALACNVYISEGRSCKVINALKASVGGSAGVALAHVFVDQPYNRTGFTLLAVAPQQLCAAAVALSRRALQLVDLRTHAATHPRLGVVDHISIHPLGQWRPLPTGSNTATTSQSASHATVQHGTDNARARQNVGNGTTNNSSHGGCTLAAAASGPAPPHGAVGSWSVPAGYAMQQAAACAKSIGEQLAAGSAASAENARQEVRTMQAAAPPTQEPMQPALPVYFYGAAHPDSRPLADLRRQLGYFQGQAGGSRWQGALPAASLEACPPDLGPPTASAEAGIATIGAVPWLVNFNVPLATDNMAIARRLAKAVSERGGGLPKVQAMALQHEQHVEVACNLLDTNASPPEAVQARLRELAEAEGLVAAAVRPGYQTGISSGELLKLAEQVLL